MSLLKLSGKNPRGPDPGRNDKPERKGWLEDMRIVRIYRTW